MLCVGSQILHAVILLCVYAYHYALVKHKSVVIEALDGSYRQGLLEPKYTQNVAIIITQHAQGLREAVTTDAWGSDHHIIIWSQSSFMQGYFLI